MTILDIEITNTKRNTNIMMKRLIADEGKVLVNNDVQANVIDVYEKDINNWIEIDYIETTENIETINK